MFCQQYIILSDTSNRKFSHKNILKSVQPLFSLSVPFVPADGMKLSLIEEQLINIKFLANIDKDGPENFEGLKQVYGGN